MLEDKKTHKQSTLFPEKEPETLEELELRKALFIFDISKTVILVLLQDYIIII